MSAVVVYDLFLDRKITAIVTAGRRFFSEIDFTQRCNSTENDKYPFSKYFRIYLKIKPTKGVSMI